MANADLDQVFSQLTQADKEALRTKAETRTFESGEAVIEEDTKPDAIYLIVAGQVRVTKGISSSLSAEFAGPLGLGEIVGEMSFIDGSIASATLVADGEVTALRFDHVHLRAMIEADPPFAARLYHSLLMILIRRLRLVNTRILLPFF